MSLAIFKTYKSFVLYIEYNLYTLTMACGTLHCPVSGSPSNLISFHSSFLSLQSCLHAVPPCYFLLRAFEYVSSLTLFRCLLSCQFLRETIFNHL